MTKANFTKTHISIVVLTVLFFVGNDIFIGYLSESSPETLREIKENVSRSVNSVSDSVLAKTDLPAPSIARQAGHYPARGESSATLVTLPTKFPVTPSPSDEEAVSDGTFFELKEVVILLPDY